MVAEPARAGFTLVEMIVAMTISTLVVGMVAGLFLAQNQFYTLQSLQSSAQDNARSVTELLAAQIRSTPAGGVAKAEKDSLRIRAPMVMGVVCGTFGQFAYVHFEGGEDGLDEEEVGGFGVLDSGTGQWSYYSTNWSGIDGGVTQAARDCYDNGADTVGIRDEFHRLRRTAVYHGSVPTVGTMIMIFRETRFAFRTSVMDPTTRGLFRASYGDTLVEYATGMDTTAQFQYRTGGSTYANSVPGGSLSSIDAIRIVAQARRPAPTGTQDEVRYGWSVNVPLRNR